MSHAERLTATTVDERGITFEKYGFPGSAMYPNGVVSWKDVREINVQLGPLRVRTDQEILFLVDPDRDAFRALARAHGVPDVHRMDVWGAIVEPALDTELNDDDHRRRYAMLERCAVTKDETDALWNDVARAMGAYNFTSFLWEWVYLGLFDVLLAFRGQLSGQQSQLPDEEFAVFYRRAMEIEMRGVIP